MTLYKNKYRIETTRLSDYDYSNCGYYFVTINTKNKCPYFGKIIDEKIILSEIGKIVEKSWLEIPFHFSNTLLDEYVIMPNHIHGILIIKDINNSFNVKTHPAERDASKDQKNINGALSDRKRDAACCVFTLKKEPNFALPKSGSLSVIIRSFKSAVTKNCRKNGFTQFEWLPRFYEHIIRSERYLEKIRQYIVKNPVKWKMDEYFITT